MVAAYYIVERLRAVSPSSVIYIPPVVALLIEDYGATLLIFAGVLLLKKE
jgi:hypothetical protein